MTTVMTSQVPAVLDYLYTACSNSAQLGFATPPVTVLDGPDPAADIRAQQKILWIGHDPSSPGMEAASATHTWPIMDHTRTRDEAGEVTCAAEYWSGTQIAKTNRDGCAAIVAAVDSLIRGDAASGGPGDASMGGLVLWSRIGAWAWLQTQASDGMSVLCVFKILWLARLEVH